MKKLFKDLISERNFRDYYINFKEDLTYRVSIPWSLYAIPVKCRITCFD